MERTVISHDTTTGKAEVKFEHNGVTLQQEFNLKLVVPGSVRIFDEMEIEFTESYQLKALDKLTDMVQKQIEEGVITNPPPVEQPEYTAPPEAAADPHVASEEEPTEETPAAEPETPTEDVVEEEPTEENTTP